MSAILGTYNFDLWNGPAPPAVKSVVDLIYRPGQAVAAAKILPSQSTESGFEGVAFVPWGTYGAYANAHAYADSYRSLIGTVVTLTYGGVSYGSVLVRDVTVVAVEQIVSVAGIHPDATSYAYSPGARVTSRWNLVRLA